MPKTGETSSAGKTWRCMSCGQRMLIEEDAEFPTCPVELKAVDWEVAEPVAVAAGAPDPEFEEWRRS